MRCCLPKEVIDAGTRFIDIICQLDYCIQLHMKHAKMSKADREFLQYYSFLLDALGSHVFDVIHILAQRSVDLSFILSGGESGGEDGK